MEIYRTKQLPGRERVASRRKTKKKMKERSRATARKPVELPLFVLVHLQLIAPGVPEGHLRCGATAAVT
ncbi:hypothetical protein GWI33_018507 [Rhynchophorus ferrugineus]|uniref:Uncharacterized protein n=1 Tax=Rhynchophorus ferrugineus TaxID=354439 RepID=A0A834HWY0_RHYFE|nr:hypothetical protein GWI33_018507 [Rhynchophorus ferrugineus]